MTDNKELIRLALQAREKAYTPYSHFNVGAALLAKNGTVFTGCNIENAAFTPTNCAERTAFFKAVSEGVKEFDAIAVVGSPEGASPEAFLFAYPCGVCRQVMREFCDPAAFRVIVAKNENDYEEYKLTDLLPHAFGPDDVR